MARSRNIKPAFFKNEYLAEVSPEARLLFIGLWTLADRNGFLEDRPKRIKGELFPFDMVDVNQLLEELENCGGDFISRIEVNGLKVIKILNFSEHQNPHPNEKSDIFHEHSLKIKSTHDLSRALIEQSGLLPITDSLLPHNDSLLLNPEIEKKIEPLEEKKINTLKPITDDWRPSERTMAMIPLNWPNKLKNIEDEVFKFKTYYQAENKLKADWDKQFQLWLNNSKVFESRGPTGVKKTDRLARIGTEEEFEKLAELQKQGVDVWQMPQ